MAFLAVERAGPFRDGNGEGNRVEVQVLAGQVFLRNLVACGLGVHNRIRRECT